MRYFKKELLQKNNSTDENTQKQAQIEWNTNISAYQREFANIQKHLPQRFLKNYLSRYGLHDYLISDVVITQRGPKHFCELQLTNGSEAILLVMSGLRAVQINLETFQYCRHGNLEWGYAEFEITKENNILLSVLCDTKNEMRFEFKSIKLNSVHSTGRL